MQIGLGHAKSGSWEAALIERSLRATPVTLRPVSRGRATLRGRYLRRQADLGDLAGTRVAVRSSRRSREESGESDELRKFEVGRSSLLGKAEEGAVDDGTDQSEAAAEVRLSKERLRRSRELRSC